tara:strand:+ start:340 stop:549 length:210 start_codon:yes stop_codon:yes gene_type:complete
MSPALTARVARGRRTPRLRSVATLAAAAASAFNQAGARQKLEVMATQAQLRHTCTLQDSHRSAIGGHHS